MRSAASLSAGSLRAAETSGAIAPPSTTMPSGAPRDASQTGKRCSNGMISALPIGDSPSIAIAMRLPAASHQPKRAKRVGSSARPTSPSAITRLDGAAKKPSTLDRTKNMPDCAETSLFLLPRLVAGLGLLVHGIEARQLGAALHLADDPGLYALVLGTLLGDEGHQILRDHHGAVVVADDDVVWKDGAAAAGDR